MKRTTGLILALLMALSMFSDFGINAFAQDSVTYSWDDEECVLTFFGSGALVDYSRKALPEWQNLSEEASKIVIEDGITEIGDYCFYETSATDIIVASTVYRIGAYAFCNAGCGVDINITFNEGIKLIEQYAFKDVYFSDSLRLPDTVERIDDDAFFGAVINDFYVPDKLLFNALIFESACVSSISISENNNNYIVYENVLYSSDMKTLVYYPSARAEKNGMAITKFSVPDSVTTISTGAFIDNIDLEIVDLNNTTTVGDYAFDGAMALCVVVSPSTVVYIGEKSFNRTPNLIFITGINSYTQEYAENNNNSVSIDGKCTLTLDANGGEFDDGTTEKTKTVVFDFEYGVLPSPHIEGMDFYGWAEINPFGNIYYDEYSVCTYPADKTLKAVWGTKSVKINIDVGEDVVWEDEPITSVKGFYGKTYYNVLPARGSEVPKKTGYHIDYWAIVRTDENGNTVYEKLDTATTITDMNEHTVKAFWAPNTYTVRLYKSATTSSSYLEQTAVYDEPFILAKYSAYTVNGYKFNYKWKDKGGNIYESGETFVNLTDYNNGTVNLYPVYDNYDAIPLNTPVQTGIDTRGGKTYFSFTPEISGTYVFYSSGRYNTFGEICDKDMNVLISDDNAGDDSNFRIVLKLEAGVLYNLVAYHEDFFTVDTSFTLIIKRIVGVTVTFDPCGGILDGNSTVSYSYGLNYGSYPVCEKEGYYFRYWTKAGSTTPITVDSEVDELNDYTLYANYEPIQYYVDLYATPRSTYKRVKRVTLTYDETSYLPTAEELGINYSGLIFVGWATTKNTTAIKYTNGQKIENLSSKAGSYISLYAVYISATHNVSLYDGNDSVGEASYTFGEDMYLPSAESLNLSKEGYEFLGWSKSPTNLQVDIEDGGLFTPEGISWDYPVLYAVWKQLVYTVNLYFDGEIVNQGIYSYDAKGKLPSTLLQLTGEKHSELKLIGYKLEGSENKIDFQPGETFVNLTTEYGTQVNIYAVTIPTGYYTVNYYVGKGVEHNTYQCENDEMLASYLDVITSSKYVTGRFIGWATQPDSKEVVYENCAIIPMGTMAKNTSLNLYAVFEEIPHNVYYVIGDAQMDEPSLTSFNEQQYLLYDMLPVPVKEDYVFTGWYLDSNYCERFDVEDRTGQIMSYDGDIILYARFEKFKVKFNFWANGGKFDDAHFDGQLYVGKEYWIQDYFHDLPAVSREGYTFEGWYTYEVGGELLNEDIPVEFAYGYVDDFYARWKPVDYTITFDANGGDCDKNSMIVSMDERLSNLPVPTRYGYSFNCWYYYDELNNKVWIFDGAKYNIPKDITLIADWNVIYSTIRFNSNGGSYVSSREIAVGKTLGKLPTTYREGYTFDGWYTEKDGGSLVKPIIIIEDHDYTFYARWTANKYIISFDAAGGICSPSEIEVAADTTSLILPVPQRKDYTFEGWYFGDEEFTSDDLVNENGYLLNFDITLTARWTYNKEEKKTGWISNGGNWYYYDEEGNMTNGWKKVGNYWYYMNSEGIMQTGWIRSKGIWYYLNQNGRMLTGWQEISGKWYYMNSSGAMQTGWIKSGNYWYYLSSSGAMLTGWVSVNSVWYYLDSPSGRMRTADLNYKGKVYHFSSSGACTNP